MPQSNAEKQAAYQERYRRMQAALRTICAARSAAEARRLAAAALVAPSLPGRKNPGQTAPAPEIA